MSNILISGASGQIGRLLLPRLVEQGHTCLCISRRSHDDSEGLRWLQADMDVDMSRIWSECDADVWIHLGFLPMGTPHLEAAFDAGVKRFVGFSSTSIFTKKETESSQEKQTIQRLIEAEANMISTCQRRSVGWTLFRPTMIYGCGMDQNIAFIQRIIERFAVFPLAGPGSGLRQPVHVEDLAQACMAALNHDESVNKAYNLSGGEVLSYRNMVIRIFQSLNCKPRMIHVPACIFKLAITLLKHLSSRYAFIQPSMVDRMAMDMVFDHDEASRDIGYTPRDFQP